MGKFHFTNLEADQTLNMHFKKVQSIFEYWTNIQFNFNRIILNNSRLLPKFYQSFKQFLGIPEKLWIGLDNCYQLDQIISEISEFKLANPIDTEIFVENSSYFVETVATFSNVEAWCGGNYNITMDDKVVDVLEGESITPQLGIYPNPTTDNVNIKLDGFDGKDVRLMIA